MEKKSKKIINKNNFSVLCGKIKKKEFLDFKYKESK